MKTTPATLTTTPRIFEMVMPITGVLDVPMDDWPAVITDKIALEMERISDRERMPVCVILAEYRVDPDKAEFEQGHHYLYVVISEVVMADDRQVDKERVVHDLKTKGLLH